MSAQPRSSETRQTGRSSILEGEAAGPAYGAAEEGGNRQSAIPNGVPLRLQNPGVMPGTSEDRARQSAVRARNYGTTVPADADADARDASGLGEQATTMEHPQQPQQSSPPAAATQRQQQAEVTGPSQLAAQPLGDPSHVHAPSSAPGLTRPVVEAVQQRARESLVHRELVQELHVQHVDQAYGSMEHVDDVGERGSTRPAWFTRMSEVIQRRVVAPVMEQVQTAGRGRTLQSPGASPQSVWHSQPSQPTTPTAPLMPQEVRQAMSSWTARPSLLTPRPRRQAEESSNGSISQEVVMEEVRKQAKAALDERESEMKRLHEENQELRQVITALSQRELQGDDGSGGRPTLMDGSLGPRGAEPRGNPGLEHRDAAAAGRIPPGLSAQSPVPGGEPPGRGASGAPPGLAEFVTRR